MNDYARAYSEQAFRSKLTTLSAFKDMIDAAKRLHALMRDPATPVWIKGLCIGALGYLILPTDAVADFIPVLGHGDDLLLLTSALSAIAAQWKTQAPVTAEE